MNLKEILAALDAPIVVRPARRMTQGELESYLDTAANILRGNSDHFEFRGFWDIWTHLRRYEPETDLLNGRIRDTWKQIPAWAHPIKADGQGF